VPNGRCCERTYQAESGHSIYFGRLQSNRDSQTLRSVYVRMPQMLAQLDNGSIVSRAVKWTMLTRPATANQPWQQWHKPTRLMRWLGWPLHHDTWTVCHNKDWKNGTWPSSENLGIGKFAQGGCQKCPPQTPNSLKQHLCRILQCNEKHGDASLSRIITGDEAQVQPYNPLTKRQSMEWHHQSSPHKKKNSRYRLL